MSTAVGSSISSTMNASRSRREQFEEQLKDLQRDISNLSSKLSVPPIINANRFANSSPNTVMNTSQAESSVHLNQSILSTHSVATHRQEQSNSGTNSEIKDFQLHIDRLSEDLTQCMKEKNILSQELQEARNEVEELKKGVVDYARLKAAYDHLKQDHDAIKASLESSERIRIQQKELISVLQRSNALVNDNQSILSFNSLSSISQRPDADSLPSHSLPVEPQKSQSSPTNQHHAWLNLPINSLAAKPIPPKLSSIPPEPPSGGRNIVERSETVERVPTHEVARNTDVLSSRPRITRTSQAPHGPPNTAIVRRTAAPSRRSSVQSTIPANTTAKTSKSRSSRGAVSGKVTREKVTSEHRLPASVPIAPSAPLASPPTSIQATYANLKSKFIQQQLAEYQQQLQQAGRSVPTPNLFPIQHLLQQDVFTTKPLPPPPPPTTVTAQTMNNHHPPGNNTLSNGKPPLYPTMQVSSNHKVSEAEVLNNSQEIGVNTDRIGIVKTNKKSSKKSKKVSSSSSKKRSASAPPAGRWMFRAVPPPSTTTTFGKADRFA